MHKAINLEELNMRSLNYAQFKRVLRGIDLEYRITGYSITLEKKVKFIGLHIPYDIGFFQCEFSIVEFENCRFSGNITLDNSDCKQLAFKGCQLQNVILKDSSLGSLTICNSSEIRKLDVYNCSVNEVVIEENPIFQEISLGCKNKIRNCFLRHSGSRRLNSFQTNVYICPEQFESFILQNLNTNVLHIGTFGNYSKLMLNDIHAEYVVFENCNGETSNVDIIDLKSGKSELGEMHLINTTIDSDVFDIKALQTQFNTKVHHKPVDVRELLR